MKKGWTMAKKLNPYDSKEWREFEKRVKNELVPKIHAAACTCSVVSGEVDVKFAVELGLSIMLDKPLIAVVVRGAKVPEKLARVVDRFVEMDPDNPASAQDGMAEAIKHVLGDDENPTV